MSTRSTASRLLSLALGTALLLAACTSDSTVSPVSDPASSTTSAAGETTTIPATTIPATTIVAPTTTEPIDPRLLLSNGVGASRFGDPAADVVSRISEILGAPTRDLSETYPLPLEGGSFMNEDESIVFIASISRSVCWSNNFCAVFGGNSSAALTFTGWDYREDPASTMYTTSGASSGVRWADAPAIVFDRGSCYSAGFGRVDGIDVIAVSAGEPFDIVTDAGETLAGDPDPADVTVVALSAGQRPTSQFEDC